MLPIKFYLEETAQLLAESENFYLVHIDRQGNYDYMNNHFVSRHSSFYNQNDIKPASIALHPDDHELSYATYLKCIEFPAKTFGATLRKLDGKGGYVITYWEYKAYRVPTGELNGVIGIGYDITAFESRKEHIRFLTETLNSMVHTQSHDIRRPLANVLGLVDLLKMIAQDQENKEVFEIADKISQSCHELNTEFELFLVKDLPESKE
jgi:hypothetical protein